MARLLDFLEKGVDVPEAIQSLDAASTALRESPMLSRISEPAPAIRPVSGELKGVTSAARTLRRIIRLNAQIRVQMRLLMGLNETDYAALSVLMRAPTGPTELARNLHLTTAATTAVVDRLVAGGHAVREPHPQDRRRTLVRALPESRSQAMAEVQPMVDMVGDAMSGMTDQDRAAVERFLDSVADHMDAWRDDLTARVTQQAEQP